MDVSGIDSMTSDFLGDMSLRGYLRTGGGQRSDGALRMGGAADKRAVRAVATV